MSYEHLVGSLGEFLEVPHERRIVRLKAVSNGSVRTEMRPTTRQGN